MNTTFNEQNLCEICDGLAENDVHLKAIIHQYGYPPFWSRTPTFATLIHIILEQQVSLESAKAAFLKLQEKIGHVLPDKILLLSDEEMKACYFSRQKMAYARHLALAVNDGSIEIDKLAEMGDDEIRTVLKKIKGIGDWTVDVYLMMVLHRADVFPPGDIALMTSIKEVKALAKDHPRQALLQIADTWRPCRTVAAFLLWHAYLSRRGKS